MTITVKVNEAKTHLSDLLAKVENGEEVIISRGNDPIARLVAIDRRQKRAEAIEAIMALRATAKPVTQAELQAWKHEGHQY